MHITEIAVRRPVATMVLFLAMAMMGGYSSLRLSVDFLPRIDVPTLLVKVDCPGLSVRDVEENVARVLEAALSTVQGVENLESVSRDGLCLIQVGFRWGLDMDIGFIKVRSRLDRVQESLPAAVERPTILRFDPASTPIMTLVVTSTRLDNPQSTPDYEDALVELKEVCEAVIKRRLEQIDGVAYVQAAGGLEREIHIYLDLEKCQTYQIDFAAVEAALRRFNVPSIGGTIREGHFQFPLRIDSEYSNLEEIYQTPIKSTAKGSTIRLRDIARVEDSYKKRTGYARLNGKEVITLFLFKEADSNTVATSEKVYEDLYLLASEYSQFRVTVAFDQAEFIQESIDYVLQSIYLGGLFVFVVLCYFLQDLKSPLVVGLAIPVSVVTTLTFMYLFDIHFNLISLGGLALGIGILVDNSIVVIENIYRYKEMGYAPRKAAIAGTKEVSTAITASTLTTVSVFLPLVYIGGLAGELFYDQSVTIALALSVSLVVSLTLMPVLVAQWDRPHSNSPPRWSLHTYRPLPLELTGKSLWHKAYRLPVGMVENAAYLTVYAIHRVLLSHVIGLLRRSISAFQQLFIAVSNRYEHILRGALRQKTKVLLLVLGLLVLGLEVGRSLQRELMPPVDRKALVLSAELPAGTSLPTTSAEIGRLETTLLRELGIEAVLSSVGITGDVLNRQYQPGLNKALLDLEIGREANTVAVTQSIKSLFADFKSLELRLRKRESVFERLFQQRPDVFYVEVFGPELESLDSVSRQIADFMRQTPGFTNVSTDLKQGKREYHLEIDRDALVRYKIGVSELVSFLKERTQGSLPTQFIDFSNKIDIRILYGEREQVDLHQLLHLQFPVAGVEKNNLYVPIADLVQLIPESGFEEIHRTDQNRRVGITATLNGLDFDQALATLEAHWRQANLPAGYWFELGTRRQEIGDEFRHLSLIIVVSIALIYFVLSAQFESIRIPLIILMAIPLALIGVVFTLWVSGNTLNIMSLLGAIVMVGIVVNDAIVKVDFIHRHYREKGDGVAAIMEAGRKRFRPIWMTTVTTVCGLLPMAVATGSGAELRKPLAWTLIGGLSLATLLTLIVIPVIYAIVLRAKAE